MDIFKVEYIFPDKDLLFVSYMKQQMNEYFAFPFSNMLSFCVVRTGLVSVYYKKDDSKF